METTPREPASSRRRPLSGRGFPARRSRMMTLSGPRRRALLAAAACLAAVTFVASRSVADPAWWKTKVKVTEATNAAATVSPDGHTIVMDVQGVLWSFDVAG